jgi:outer membrane protein assembly factor BamB
MRYLPTILCNVAMLCLSAGCAEEIPSAESVQEKKLKQQTSNHSSPQDASGTGSQQGKAISVWTRFRGPNGSGIATDTNVPLEWSATKNIVWKTPLPGPGASSPILFGDHIYLTCYTGYGLDKKEPGNPNDLKYHLLCVNRKDGKILWSAVTPSAEEVAPYKDFPIQMHGYASSTPVADETGVYVFFGTTGLLAYNHAGQPLWKASCGKDTHIYGTATSPILHDGLVIVNAEVESQALLAFDKKTGNEQWRLANAGGKGNSWGTPGIFQLNGRTELVYASGFSHIAGVDPARGSKLWEFETETGRVNACLVAHEDMLFVMSGPVPQAVGLRIRNGEATRLWHYPNKGAYVTSPIFHEGRLYWVHDGRIAYCLEAESGKEIYRERLQPDSGDVYAGAILAGDRIYYVSRENGTYVVPASPEFRLLAHNKIETDTSVFNGTPAVADGQLFLRSNRMLYCIGKQ